MSLHDEPTDPLPNPESSVGPPGAGAPLVTWSWRTATAAGLGIAAVVLYIFALGQRPGPVSLEHINPIAGFSIEPPPGWTDRVDDRDGTFIRPDGADADRRSSITISARLAHDSDPMLAFADIQARPVSGPIRRLRWHGSQRVTLDSGLPAVLAEFTQVYRGVPMHGWMVLVVHDARLLHAVGVVPEVLRETEQLQLVAALHSLSPLFPDLPEELEGAAAPRSE